MNFMRSMVKEFESLTDSAVHVRHPPLTLLFSFIIQIKRINWELMSINSYRLPGRVSKALRRWAKGLWKVPHSPYSSLY